MDTHSTASSPSISSHATDSQSCTAATQMRDKNIEQIAALREDTEVSHVAEHIRGMVAATMATGSAQLPGIAESTAQQWQSWALGVADGLSLPMAGSHQTLLCSTSPC